MTGPQLCGPVRTGTEYQHFSVLASGILGLSMAYQDLSQCTETFLQFSGTFYSIVERFTAYRDFLQHAGTSQESVVPGPVWFLSVIRDRHQWLNYIIQFALVCTAHLSLMRHKCVRKAIKKKKSHSRWMWTSKPDLFAAWYEWDVSEPIYKYRCGSKRARRGLGLVIQKLDRTDFNANFTIKSSQLAIAILLTHVASDSPVARGGNNNPTGLEGPDCRLLTL